MYFSLIKLVLSFFDSFNKRKILFFFKKNIESKISFFVDVGAHHGETIKIFNKNFDIKNILAFEPSPYNYQQLLKETKNIEGLKIYDFGLGEKKGIVDFKQHYESSSSTMTKINDQSDYFKRKNFYLNFFNKKKPQFECIKVKIDRLDNIFNSLEINKIDILKIDTEGYDFNVIKGLGNHIKNVKYIYFEHHFHNMLVKSYTLNDVHSFMEQNNFEKVFKIKMYFRKTFEYIYFNKSFIKL